MARLIITHGRSQEFETPATLHRQWSEDLRWGLERVDAPFAATIPIGFAFYGDHWRVDAADLERADAFAKPSDFQLRLASELISAAPENHRGDVERLGWDTLSGLVGTLDQTLGVGKITLSWFVKDVDSYFSDDALRAKAIQRVIDAVREQNGDVVLLAHSLGTVVAYDTLRRNPDLPVRGLVTFGSPLGLATIQDRLRETGGDLVFPPGVRRWANIYEKRDFVAANIPLAKHFPSHDTREVEDSQSKGRKPSFLKLVNAHDARVYLSSVALAKAARSIVEAVVAAEPAERGERPSPARGTERRIPPSFGVSTNGGHQPVAANGGARRRSIPDGLAGDSEQDRSWDDAAAMVGDEPSTEPMAAAERNGAETREVKRAAAASFPPLVAPGSQHELRFEVGRKVAGDIATELSARVPVEATRLDLTVIVQASHFDILDADTGEPSDGVTALSLDLGNENDHQTGRFLLRAEDTGARSSSDIRLRFLYDGNPIGTIALPTIIAPGAAGGDLRPETVAGNLSHRADQPSGAELTLFVTQDDGKYEIMATLTGGTDRTSPLYRLGSFPVTDNASKYAKGILERFRLSRELSKSERRSRINALGLDLWRNLPDEFHEFYWKRIHDKVESILVCSEEPYIPWELIKPERSVGGRTAPMLGMAYSMARWEDQRDLPASITVSDFAVIAPAYPSAPLPSADVEARELQDRFRARRIDPGRRSQVLQLFRERTPQVLHFSGHGTFEELPEDSKIALADSPLELVDVNVATFAKREQPPLVFLNACEVGDIGWSLTQIGSWGEAFCRAGSTGFVGPYWAVSDVVARKAAMVFYRGLQAGLTVGEAMMEVRERFNEDEEYRYHPTWLAYSLHCHPNVQVRFAPA